MKLIKNLGLCLSPALLGLGLAGCASSNPVTPLGSGYEEVGHPHRPMTSTADERLSLQYRAPDGKITRIWPSLYGVNEVVNGDVAIFVGDVSFVSPDPDNPRGTKPRLFAVKSPALPQDITDEVLWRWSKMWGKDFSQARQLFTLATPGEKNGRLELELQFWTDAKDWPDKTTVQLEWSEVSNIMNEMKAAGTVHKDLHWDAPYLAR